MRWEEKELIKASKKRGIPLRLVDAKNIYFNLLKEERTWKNSLGNIVIQRCISYFRGLHITAILENAGLPVINSLQTALTCGNKLFNSLALIKAGLPHPKTSMAFTPEKALVALKDMGYPAVLKPVVGSWGRLVALVKDPESAQALIETREEIKNSLLRQYYIQELVKRPSRDIRVIIIGEEAVAASYRYTPPDDWRTNVARGGQSKPCPITQELFQLSIKASEAVGGGVVAVDCMEGPEGLLVHEVNNTVEFRGLSSTTDVNIAEKILEYARMVVKR